MERTVQELVLGVVRRQTPTGASVVIEGAPGIGKTFMAREILDSVAPGEAKILRVAGQQGRRNDPFTVAGQLLGGVTGDTDPDPGIIAGSRKALALTPGNIPGLPGTTSGPFSA